MKTIKVYNNEHFWLDNMTAVVTSENLFEGASYENTIKVYAYGHSLVDIICDHKYLEHLMDRERYTVEKYWDGKDVIIITINKHTFGAPFVAECEEW